MPAFVFFSITPVAVKQLFNTSSQLDVRKDLTWSNSLATLAHCEGSYFINQPNRLCVPR